LKTGDVIQVVWEEEGQRAAYLCNVHRDGDCFTVSSSRDEFNEVVTFDPAEDEWSFWRPSAPPPGRDTPDKMFEWLLEAAPGGGDTIPSIEDMEEYQRRLLAVHQNLVLKLDILRRKPGAQASRSVEVVELALTSLTVYLPGWSSTRSEAGTAPVGQLASRSPKPGLTNIAISLGNGSEAVFTLAAMTPVRRQRQRTNRECC